MKVVILLLFAVSCLEIDQNHNSALLGTERQDTYVKTVLSDFGVRKNVYWSDTKYPTILHYFSYEPRKVTGTPVQLGAHSYKSTGGVFNFQNIILSYQKKDEDKEQASYI